MKKYLCLYILLFAGVLLTTGCKTGFERLRTSGNNELILEKAYDYYEKGDYLKAQTLFEQIINTLRGRTEAEKVYFYYAYTHYHMEKFILGSYYFKNFSSTFPNSAYREEADFMSAYSNYQLSPSYRLDQTYSRKAIEEFQLFVNTYPRSERVSEANELIDGMRVKMEKKDFEAAELYYDLKQYQAAIQSYQNLLKDYPGTSKGEQIQFMIVKSGFELASNSIFEKREERYLETLANIETFKNKYPGSRFGEQVDSIFKKTENKLDEHRAKRYQNQSSRS